MERRRDLSSSTLPLDLTAVFFNKSSLWNLKDSILKLRLLYCSYWTLLSCLGFAFMSVFVAYSGSRSKEM